MKFEDVSHLVMGTRGRAAEQAGDPDGGIWSAGQVVGTYLYIGFKCSSVEITLRC